MMYEPMFMPISSTKEPLTPASFMMAICSGLGGPPPADIPGGGPDIVSIFLWYLDCSEGDFVVGDGDK